MIRVFAALFAYDTVARQLLPAPASRPFKLDVSFACTRQGAVSAADAIFLVEIVLRFSRFKSAIFVLANIAIACVLRARLAEIYAFSAFLRLVSSKVPVPALRQSPMLKKERPIFRFAMLEMLI